MLILCVDTSTPHGDLALIQVNETAKTTTVGQCHWHKLRSHSEEVTVHLSQLLKRHNYKLQDLSLLACGVGPGSFTGLRVTVNLIRSLAYSLNLPIFSISSLELMAYSALKKTQPILCLTNAFKNQVYMSSFIVQNDQLICEHKPQSISCDDLNQLVSKQYICLGDAYDIFYPQFSNSLKQNLLRDQSLNDYPLAQNFCHLSQKFRESDNLLNWDQLKPLYIRASEAEENLRTGLLKPQD